MRARSFLIPLALALVLPLAGCLSSSAPSTTVPPADAFQDDAQVARGNGTFTLDASEERVTWENGNAHQARVNVTLTLAQGSVTVRVLDGNGFPVFERAFTGENEGTITTSRGVPGVWSVTLTPNEAKGDWRVRAQAA